MSAIALYYPWMHFQSDSWVKLALLTWDKIARMHAKGLENRDSALVRQVRDESDLIMELTPAESDLDVVAMTFNAALNRDRAALVERFGRVDYPESAPRRRRERPRRQPTNTRNPKQDNRNDDNRYRMAASNTGLSYSPPTHSLRPGPGRRANQSHGPADESYQPIRGKDPRTFWVFCGEDGTKINGTLMHTLIGAGLAVADPDGGPWLRMRPKLGSLYLAALADSVCRNNLLTPATDDPRMHRAYGALGDLTDLLFDRIREPALEDAESAYVHLALRAVIEPERLAEVPVAKLLKFRLRYQAELAAFRHHVAGLGAELHQLAQVENLAAAQAHLESLYVKNTKPQLDELRAALRGLGVESTAGALGLKVDLSAAAGTVLGGVAATGGQLMLAGTAVAVTVIPYAASKFAARREHWGTSPVAYLLAADRQLAGSSLLHALRRS